MKRIVWIIAVLAVIILIAGLYKYTRKAEAKTVIVYTELSRGNLENVISSTGTIEPISTVEVGTEVSGTIDKIYIDYNDIVKKGQVLAVLDTTFLSAAVKDAQAGILKAQAQYNLSVKEYEKYLELYKKNYISEFDIISYETAKKANFVSLQSTQTNLDKAVFNIEHALIHSPIAGKILSRNVEEGQTVAASFSTPTLFIIAEDMTKMEIHALVDESDIGQIKVGQEVKFTVEAYFDKTFNGKVREIWLEPATISNVVTYTVIVDASNKDGFLLPGMTATIDFIINKKENVLIIENSALHIKLTDEMIGFAKNKTLNNSANQNSTDSLTVKGAEDQRVPENSAELWMKDSSGIFIMIPVVTGMTDGKMTEIIDNGKIKEGMKIVSSVDSKNAVNASPKGLNMTLMGRGPR